MKIPVESISSLKKDQKIIRKWSDEEMLLLGYLSQVEEWGSNRIFKSHFFPSRSLASIKGVVARLGFADLRVSRRKEIKDFLLNEGRFTLNHEVAKKFGISVKMVRYYRSKLGVSLPPHISRATDHYRESHLRVLQSPKTQAGLRKYFEQYRQGRRGTLIARFFAQIRAGKFNDDIKTCATCGDVWFNNSDFFYTRESRKEGARVLYRYCKACGLPWRKNAK